MRRTYLWDGTFDQETKPNCILNVQKVEGCMYQLYVLVLGIFRMCRYYMYVLVVCTGFMF